MEVIGKKVKLTKLKDTKFEGAHPYGIDEGYEKIGIAINELEVGQFFYVQKGMRQFRSSPVTKINDDGTFNTQNSLYKIEILSEEENGTEEV